MPNVHFIIRGNCDRITRTLMLGLTLGLQQGIIIVSNMTVKIHGNPRQHITMEEFNSYIDKCGLVEFKSSRGNWEGIGNGLSQIELLSINPLFNFSIQIVQNLGQGNPQIINRWCIDICRHNLAMGCLISGIEIYGLLTMISFVL